MLRQLLESHPKILAEAAIAERLRRDSKVTLHETLYNTPLIYGPEESRAIMTRLYQEYLEVARDANLPILMTAPTWRLDAKRVAEARVPETINTDAVNYLLGVRQEFASEADILIGALTGPQNDCYRPELAPDADAAEQFHTPQIEELAATEADFLQSQTLPSVEEAIGVARAMRATGKPFIISFCTGQDGKILDGAPLEEAMERVDQMAAPVGYYVNCTHPQFILNAYQDKTLDRLIGIQANASSKDVTSLDGASETQADSLSSWLSAMLRLHREHSVQVLGGCCGTSLAHLQGLSES